MPELDSPGRIAGLRAIINAKPVLKSFYQDVYARYAACIEAAPRDGLIVELGSGGGFAQELIPGLITTDVLPYDGVDQVVDATKMPFADGSVRFFGMLNVFHHIPNVEAFLAEATRCLAPGGRMLIIDQHPGWLGKPILRYIHHEPFRPDAENWHFDSTGPLSGANGALAWIVFVRDFQRFQKDFPCLSLRNYRPFAPLSYWLAGGLKSWSLLPGPARSLAKTLDRTLLSLSKDAGCFVEIDVVRS